MKYCLIGKSLSHSYSATLHRGYGLDYALEEVAPADLERFVRDSAYDGFNVTIPYKTDVMAYLDEVSPLAARAGAVNTVLRRDGRTVGYNTDYYGFRGAIDYYHVDIKGRACMVLGSGGASKVVVLALQDMGAKSVTVVSRTGRVNYGNCYDHPADILVNATPVGTYPNVDDCPVDVTRWPHLEFVYDLVYNPYRTRLVCEARHAGIPAQNGLAMLVIQALAAREIWQDTPYDAEDVKRCLGRLRADTLNIALMGMPSAGKSTVGRAVAQALSKTLVDTDDLVTADTHRTPRQIIEEEGEPAFRDVEALAVQKACSLRGAVIALGGGSVLRQANRSLIRQTAMVVYLRRDLSALTDADRPTLQQAGAAALFAARDPIYRATMDVAVDNVGDVAVACQAIIDAYEYFSD